MVSSGSHPLFVSPRVLSPREHSRCGSAGILRPFHPLQTLYPDSKREFTMHHDSGVRSRTKHFKPSTVVQPLGLGYKESHDCPASSPGQYPRVARNQRISPGVQQHVESFGGVPLFTSSILALHYLLASKAALALSTASFAFSSSAFPSNG